MRAPAGYSTREDVRRNQRRSSPANTSPDKSEVPGDDGGARHSESDGYYSALRLALLLLVVLATSAPAQLRTLRYAPSPPDNPLRGLVPYSGEKRDKFPHSMEFNYLSLSDLMTGPNQFRWEPLERLLNNVASRGHQVVFRVWIEMPGKKGIRSTCSTTV